MTNHQTELVPAKTIEARWGFTPDDLHRAANKGHITEYRLGSRTLRYNPDEVLTRLVYNTTDIDPSQNQTSPRDRLARIIAELTNLHNQLPH